MMGTMDRTEHKRGLHNSPSWLETGSAKRPRAASDAGKPEGCTWPDMTFGAGEVGYNLSFVIKSFRGEASWNPCVPNMPIYEYRCASCGHELEALQKLRDAPLTDCPACHKAELKKRVSAAGFQLKGSGWYVTDFRNSGAKTAAKQKPADGDAAKGNGDAATANAAGASSGDGAKSESKTGDTGGTGKAAESKPSAATRTAGASKSASGRGKLVARLVI